MKSEECEEHENIVLANYNFLKWVIIVLILGMLVKQKMGMLPIHPGEILKEMYLSPMGINITQLAENIGVTSKKVSQLINGHMGINAEMAIRLGKAFDTTPILWLNLQRNYDLWNACSKINVSKITSLRTDTKIKVA